MSIRADRDPFYQSADRARLRAGQARRGVFHAVKTGNLLELVRLLDSDPDADIGQLDLNGESLLHIASMLGHKQIVYTLLERHCSHR